MEEKAKCKNCTNEKEMIEEMAEFFKSILPTGAMADWIPIKIKHDYKGYAKELYNAGYRKPLEGAVVLSPDEYNRLKRDSELYEARHKVRLKIFEKAYNQGSKETAKEILQLVKEKSWCYKEDENGEAWTYSITVAQLKELAKKYGVEIKE